MKRAPHESVPVWVSVIVFATACAGMFLAVLATWPRPALVLEILQRHSLHPWWMAPSAAPVSLHAVVSGGAAAAVVAVAVCGLVVAYTRLIARLAAREPSDLVHRIPQRNDAVRR